MVFVNTHRDSDSDIPSGECQKRQRRRSARQSVHGVASTRNEGREWWIACYKHFHQVTRFRPRPIAHYRPQSHVRRAAASLGAIFVQLFCPTGGFPDRDIRLFTIGRTTKFFVCALLRRRLLFFSLREGRTVSISCFQTELRVLRVARSELDRVCARRRE